VVIAWFYYTLFYAEEHWRIGGLTMGIFMIASLGFYLWGLFRLKSISMADISLKESLTQLIKQFKLYIKAYLAEYIVDTICQFFRSISHF
jgi:hypothetical protein